jgi:4-amino-4-deoxy-L-arabinose transferase-like glycosyltransferase
MTDRRLEAIAGWTPLLILAYFAAQFIIRVGLSANLETDEAQFVGQTYLALGYNNSHPPLYNWLVAGALALTGGYWPAALSLVKNFFVAGTYLLSFDIARRVTGRALPGLIIVAGFMLLPQIVWKSQVTLAHSVLVMFAVVAVLHAVVYAVEQGDLASFFWLGLAAAIGALAKYNFFLVLAAVVVAAWSIPSMRARLFTPRLGWSLAILAAAMAPHYLWALQNLGQTTARMAKLDRESSAFVSIDIPFIGVDGFLSLAVSLAAWTAPLLAAWFAIRHFSGKSAESDHPAKERIRTYARFFARTTLIAVGVFAAIVLLGDLHSVRERYLTPMLMPLPFWLAFAWPLETRPRAPVHFLRLSGAIAMLMVTAWPAWMLLGKDQFAYPYQAFTQALGAAVPGPFAVLGPHDKYGANIAARLERAERWGEGSGAGQVVVLWEPKPGRSPNGLAARLGSGFTPRGAVIAMDAPYENLSGELARLNGQLYARKP